MERPQSLSVVMALYNERAHLPEALPALEAFLRQREIDYELVIVESGSTDGSGELLDQLAAGNSRMTVIHEGARRGFGSGLRLGLQRARKPAVMYVDVDLCLSTLSLVPPALAMLEEFDVVIGQRIGPRESATRRIGSAVYNRVLGTALGLGGVRDINCSFKMFRRAALERFDLQANGWFIDAEILSEAKRQGCRIGMVAVPYRFRTAGASTVHLGYATTGQIIDELIGYWRRRVAAGSVQRIR